MKYHVEYDSNNSGGDWWLRDADWKALEEAGWAVHWKADPREQTGMFVSAYEDGRWLGALATSACRFIEADTEAEAEAIARIKWQHATGQDPDEEGCSCCGRPHYFSTYGRDCQWHGHPVEVPA